MASYRTSPPIGSNGWTLNGQDTSKIIKITESSAENCKESDDDESPGTHPPSGDTALCSTILDLGSLFEKALKQLGNDFNDVIPPLNIYWKVVRSLSHSSGQL